MSYGDRLSAQGTPLPLVPPLAQIQLPFSPCQNAQTVLVRAHAPGALLSIVWDWHTHTGVSMEVAVGAIAFPE